MLSRCLTGGAVKQLFLLPTCDNDWHSDNKHRNNSTDAKFPV